MKKIIYTLTLLIFIACSSKPEVKYPYSFIDKKTEGGSENNKMELYTITAKPSLDTLKMFCSEKKENYYSGTFLYIVFFDRKQNAVFPNNPFTAFYGMDEEPLIHIKAYYEYNSLNGYSQLKIYDSNAWQGKALNIKI